MSEAERISAARGPSRPDGATWVALREVSVRLGGDLALAGVSLALAAGDRLVVLGPNGGGKSTLVRTLLGLVAPSAGTVEWSRPRRSLRFGYVPQFPSFDRSFPIRVRDLVAQGRLARERASPGDSGSTATRESDLLDRLALRELAGAYLAELSGGELKRALVARALIGGPEILVLDEPTASLDEASRRTLWSLLAELPAETAIVLATHDLAPRTFAATRALLVDRTVSTIDLDGLHTHPLLCGHVHD